MQTVGTAVGALAGIGGLVCYILILIQIFQHGKTGMGIACLLLLFCCGGGYVLAFIYGWMKAREWNMNNLMTIWSVFFGVHILAGAISPPPIREYIFIQQR